MRNSRSARPPPVMGQAASPVGVRVVSFEAPIEYLLFVDG